MSKNDKVTPKIGTLHYNCHFEMLTPINLGSHFFIFLGDCQRITWFVELSQQQQNELNDGVPSMHSPYDNEGRWQRDRWVPRPALCHPRLSPWTQLLNLVNDQALITSCAIDFESFLTLLR